MFEGYATIQLDNARAQWKRLKRRLSVKSADQPMSEIKGDGWEAKAAITPEMQEEMMRTPIKRVGA